MSAYFYSPAQMKAVATLFEKIEAAYKEFDPSPMSNHSDQPLYIFSTEIVIRHADGYTVGRIGMDDFLFFEATDETYGEVPKQ